MAEIIRAYSQWPSEQQLAGLVVLVMFVYSTVLCICRFVVRLFWGHPQGPTTVIQGTNSSNNDDVYDLTPEDILDNDLKRLSSNFESGELDSEDYHLMRSAAHDVYLKAISINQSETEDDPEPGDQSPTS